MNNENIAIYWLGTIISDSNFYSQGKFSNTIEFGLVECLTRELSDVPAYLTVTELLAHVASYGDTEGRIGNYVSGLHLTYTYQYDAYGTPSRYASLKPISGCRDLLDPSRVTNLYYNGEELVAERYVLNGDIHEVHYIELDEILENLYDFMSNHISDCCLSPLIMEEL